MNAICWILVSLMIVLSGCGANADAQPETTAATSASQEMSVVLSNTVTAQAESSFRIEARLGPTLNWSDSMVRALEEDWKQWEDKFTEQIISSSMPGTCNENFDSWEDACAYLGQTLPNPLDGMEGLEIADTNGQPLDDPAFGGERTHAQLSWHGDKDAKIREAMVWAGYREDTIRISLRATLYGGVDMSYTTGGAWGQAVRFEHEYAAMQNGSNALLLFPSGLKNYCTADAFFVQGSVLYTLHLTGEPGQEDAVRACLDRLLAAF